MILLVLLLAFQWLAKAVHMSPSTATEDRSSSTYLLTSEVVVATNMSRSTGPVAKRTTGPVLVKEHPWEEAFFFFHSTIDHGDELWLYYHTFTGNASYLCLATSTDHGTTFTKPELGQVSFANSTANNIVLQLSTHPEFVWPGMVFIDTSATAEPSQRFKMTVEHPGNAGMDLYGSADGLHWRLLFSSIIGGTFADTQPVVFYDLRRGRYLAYGRGYVHPGTEKGRPCPGSLDSFRQVVWSQSDKANLSRWSSPETVLGFDDLPECVDIYNNAAIQVHNAYFLLPSELLHLKWAESHGDDVANSGVTDIRLAVSSDGRSFQYTDGLTLIDRGVGAINISARGADWHYTGSFDSGIIFAVRGYHETDAALYLFYWGSQKTHGDFGGSFPDPAAYPNASSGFGRATLRKNGWFSYNTEFPTTGSTVGYLQTSAFVLSPGKLSSILVNAEVSVRGSLQIQVVNNLTGEVVPGYELNNSIPIVGNHLRAPMQWHNLGCGLPQYPSAVRFEFVASFAKLFSFDIAPVHNIIV